MNRIRLRCYMRGLGIGIVVTALIMGIAMSGRRNTMSDDEVRERARELGMVESTVLSQLQGQQKQDNQEDGTAPEDGGTPEDGSAPEGRNDPENDGSTESESVPTNGRTPDDGVDSENVDTPEEDGGRDENRQPQGSGNSEMQVGNVSQEESETVLFTITRGESSSAVCQALEAAGLVEDAGTFDRYLCDNGYATRIVAGTYRIPVNATEEEVIEMIIKK